MTQKPQPHTHQRKVVPLKRFLMPTLIPLALLVVGTAVMGIKTQAELHLYTQELEEQTLSNVKLAQRNSTNLQNLSNSLQDLIYSSDARRARLSYQNALSLIAVSTFDHHERTQPVAATLEQSLQDTWDLRVQYDEQRKVVNDLFAELHLHLLAAAGLAAGVGNTPPTFLNDTIQQSIQHLEPEAAHRDHSVHLADSFRNLCSGPYTPANGERRQAFLEHCAVLRGMPQQIDAETLKLQKAKEAFLERALEMRQDGRVLRQEYAEVETNDLLGLIRQANVFYGHWFTIYALLLLFSIALTIFVMRRFYKIVQPLGVLSDKMRQFLSTNQMPQFAIESQIREIQDVMQWLMKFCEMICQKRASLNTLTSQYYELLSESYKDPLTELANRRAFEELIESHDEVPMHSAVLLIDIDHFKRINDTKGHLFGDLILKTFGQQLRKCMARTDVIYRYGGEEFCILLSRVTYKSTNNFAERIRKRIRQISTEDGSIVVQDEAAHPLSVSIGISSITESTGEKDILTLVREADLALYQAKRQGRNRVKHFEDVLPTEEEADRAGSLS